MSLLVRAAELVGRPVVTLAGDDVAQVKDVVYTAEGGDVAGFTLNGRGLFAGPLKTSLPWAGVHGLGRDALVVEGEQAFVPREELLAQGRGKGAGTGDVLGARVLTDTGVDLGKVVDVVVESSQRADVVGYEIDSSSALGRDGRRVFVPLPDTLAVSVEALVVPAAVVDFVTDDLAGFGAAVTAFRERLGSTA